jgi:hypothetical protein
MDFGQVQGFTFSHYEQALSGINLYIPCVADALNPFSWLACFFLEEILPKNKLKEYLQ